MRNEQLKRNIHFYGHLTRNKLQGLGGAFLETSCKIINY